MRRLIKKKKISKYIFKLKYNNRYNKNTIFKRKYQHQCQIANPSENLGLTKLCAQ